MILLQRLSSKRKTAQQRHTLRKPLLAKPFEKKQLVLLKAKQEKPQQN